MDNTEKKLLLFVPLSALIINFFVINNLDKPALVINYLTLAIVIAFLPLFIYKFYKEKRINELYEDIRQFFKDLSYYLSLGYSLKKAIEEIYKNNIYSQEEFNKLIKDLYLKINKGYSIEKTFEELLTSLKNPIINSFKTLIIHVIKNSERLDILFENIANELNEEIKRERKRKERTYSVLVTTYVSFFLFLILVVLLITKVINFQLQGLNLMVSVYISLLTFLVYEESLLSGFVIGQLVSNDFISGVVHSFIFIGITYIIFITFLI